MADVTGTAAPASAVVAGYGSAVLVFLTPKLYFLFLCALDTALAHLDNVLYLRLRKLSDLPEDDIEAETEYSKPDKSQSCYKNFHKQMSDNYRSLVDEA